jgi:adenosylhomocysteine nucleosidase
MHAEVSHRSAIPNRPGGRGSVRAEYQPSACSGSPGGSPSIRQFWIVLSLLVLLAGLIGPARGVENAPPPVTAVLGAMSREVDPLIAQLQSNRTETVSGLTVHLGTLRGRSVVLARTGVGKVNAAMTTALVLDHFHPAEVLFTGVAGGLNPELLPGDIVIGEKVAQHDFGDLNGTNFTAVATGNPANGQRNPLFFPAPPRLLALVDNAAKDLPLQKLATTRGDRLPRVIRGVIVTGDVFVASPEKVAELRGKFGADAVEMEGAAVAQVCWQAGVPCLVIRSVSDKADAAANADFKKFLQTAAGNSARLILAILDRLR